MLKTTGCEILKPLFKFFESNSGTNAADVTYQLSAAFSKIDRYHKHVEFFDNCKANPPLETKESRETSVINHLETMKTAIKDRYDCWFQFPLKVTALRCSDISTAKQVAQEILDNYDDLLHSIVWLPLFQFLTYPSTKQELLDFVQSDDNSDQYSTITAFCTHYFSFPIHQIHVERINCEIVAYKEKARNCTDIRIHARIRNKHNNTTITLDMIRTNFLSSIPSHLITIEPIINNVDKVDVNEEIEQELIENYGHTLLNLSHSSDMFIPSSDSSDEIEDEEDHVSVDQPDQSTSQTFNEYWKPKNTKRVCRKPTMFFYE